MASSVPASLLERTVAAGFQLPVMSRAVWGRGHACSRLGPQGPCTVLLLHPLLCQSRVTGKADSRAPAACTLSSCVKGTAPCPVAKVGRSMCYTLLSVFERWGLGSA